MNLRVFLVVSNKLVCTFGACISCMPTLKTTTLMLHIGMYVLPTSLVMWYVLVVKSHFVK